MQAVLVGHRRGPSIRHRLMRRLQGCLWRTAASIAVCQDSSVFTSYPCAFCQALSAPHH